MLRKECSTGKRFGYVKKIMWHGKEIGKLLNEFENIVACLNLYMMVSC